MSEGVSLEMLNFGSSSYPISNPELPFLIARPIPEWKLKNTASPS